MTHVEMNDQELPSLSGMTEWAWKAMEEKSWSEAAKRWRLIRGVYPGCESAWVQGGIAEKNLNNFDHAQQLLEVACDRFPKNSTAWIVLADIQLELKGLSSCEPILFEIQERFPDIPYPFLKRAQYFLSNNKFIDAEKENAVARKEYPDLVNPFIQYAELAEKQSEWKEALKRWGQLRKRFPDHPAGYKRAAIIAETLGDVELARKLKLSENLGIADLDNIILDEESAEVLKPIKQRSWIHLLELIWTKSRLNLKSEASQNYLRYVWWVLDPLLYMVVFYVVFGLLLQRGGEGYLAFLLTGLVPFQWFAKTTQLASGSILGGRGLMSQVKIPPIFFPLVMVTQTAGKQMMIFGMLIVFLLFYGIEPSLSWLGLIPVLLVQLILVITTACFVAMIIPFVRDLSNLVPTGIQFLMFASGIFYSVESLSEDWKSYFYLNPVATLINEYRTILLDGDWPSWSSLGWVFSFSMLGLLLAVFFYSKLAPLYPRVVIE